MLDKKIFFLVWFLVFIMISDIDYLLFLGFVFCGLDGGENLGVGKLNIWLRLYVVRMYFI